MKYRDLHIQTQREAPNNARTPGFGWLARAGYMDRERRLLPLGEQAILRLKSLAQDTGGTLFSRLALPVIGNGDEVFFPISTGSTEVIHCPACGYTARKELALFQKPVPLTEAPRPLEKVHTPGSNTIESLAAFLNIPKEQTAKAMLFTRLNDGKFVFVVIRGDMTLSEAKLTNVIGEVRLATAEEINNAGAAAGYASPVGLKGAWIIVDDLIPRSANLVAGANEAGYHLLNTNCGRDYQPDQVTDLTLASEGEPCLTCTQPLSDLSAESLKQANEIHFDRLLLALAEVHFDDKGLTLPAGAAPFDVYLMHVPGRQIDTGAKAEEIYDALEKAGISVLFDDRDERAGVKFNDADLIGLPHRVVVGEKNIVNGMIELKPRPSKETQLVPISNLIEIIQNHPTL